MFPYFFAYQNDIPDGAGFPVFGGRHLLWMFGIALAIALAALYFRRQNARKKERILNVTVLAALLLTLIHDIILGVIGEMNLRMLPLHLCDLASCVYLVHRIAKFPALAEVNVCLLMPGAASAILFPEWTAYPTLNFMTLHGFAYHALVVLYPVLLLAGGSVRPRIRHIWKPLLFLACVAAPIYVFDRIFDSNYLFLSYAPASSPLEILENRLGNPGYLVAYGALVFLILFFIYCVFEAVFFFKERIRSSRRKDQSS